MMDWLRLLLLLLNLHIGEAGKERLLLKTKHLQLLLNRMLLSNQIVWRLVVGRCGAKRVSLLYLLLLLKLLHLLLLLKLILLLHRLHLSDRERGWIG